MSHPQQQTLNGFPSPAYEPEIHHPEVVQKLAPTPVNSEGGRAKKTMSDAFMISCVAGSIFAIGWISIEVSKNGTLAALLALSFLVLLIILIVVIKSDLSPLFSRSIPSNNRAPQPERTRNDLERSIDEIAGTPHSYNVPDDSKPKPEIKKGLKLTVSARQCLPANTTIKAPHIIEFLDKLFVTNEGEKVTTKALNNLINQAGFKTRMEEISAALNSPDLHRIGGKIDGSFYFHNERIPLDTTCQKVHVDSAGYLHSHHEGGESIIRNDDRDVKARYKAVFARVGDKEMSFDELKSLMGD